MGGADCFFALGLRTTLKPNGFFSRQVKTKCLRRNILRKYRGPVLNIFISLICYFSNLNWSNDGKYTGMTFLNSVKIIRARDTNCIKEFKVSSGLYSEFSPDDKLLVIGTAKSGYLVDISKFLQ